MNVERLISQLRFHEGVEHKVYKDSVGIETIGVGRNLVDRGLSEDEIDYLLKNDIEIVLEEIVKNFNWYNSLDDVRQRCICDLVFNMGMPRYLKVVNHLSAIEKGDWERAKLELLNSNYAKQVGKRAERIAEMIFTGNDSRDF